MQEITLLVGLITISEKEDRRRKAVFVGEELATDKDQHQTLYKTEDGRYIIYYIDFRSVENATAYLVEEVDEHTLLSDEYYAVLARESGVLDAWSIDDALKYTPPSKNKRGDR